MDGDADPVEIHGLPVDGLDEAVETEVLHLPAQLAEREVGQEDHGVLGDVPGQVLGIELFSFLHAGVTYHFTYVTNQSSLGAMRKSFEASARTITFKK